MQCGLFVVLPVYLLLPVGAGLQIKTQAAEVLNSAFNSCYSSCGAGSGVVQVLIQVGVRDFLFSKTAMPTLGSTQTPVY